MQRVGCIAVSTEGCYAPPAFQLRDIVGRLFRSGDNYSYVVVPLSYTGTDIPVCAT